MFNGRRNACGLLIIDNTLPFVLKKLSPCFRRVEVADEELHPVKLVPQDLCLSELLHDFRHVLSCHKGQAGENDGEEDVELKLHFDETRSSGMRLVAEEALLGRFSQDRFLELRLYIFTALNEAVRLVTRSSVVGQQEDARYIKQQLKSSGQCCYNKTMVADAATAASNRLSAALPGSQYPQLVIDPPNLH